MTRRFVPPPDLAERLAALAGKSKARANQPRKPVKRCLWLATDGVNVCILRCSNRAMADRYASNSGLTILRTTERELHKLVQQGATVVVV